MKKWLVGSLAALECPRLPCLALHLLGATPPGWVSLSPSGSSPEGLSSRAELALKLLRRAAGPKESCPSPSGLLEQNARDRVAYKQQKHISHHSGG